MKRTNNPFLSYYPSIDLHGEDKVGAIVKFNDFINDSIKLKNYNIIIVHGKGTGVLRKSIHEYLRKDKRIVSFKTDNLNDGITIVYLKEELWKGKMDLL